MQAQAQREPQHLPGQPQVLQASRQRREKQVQQMQPEERTKQERPAQLQLLQEGCCCSLTRQRGLTQLQRQQGPGSHGSASALQHCRCCPQQAQLPRTSQRQPTAAAHSAAAAHPPVQQQQRQLQTASQA